MRTLKPDIVFQYLFVNDQKYEDITRENFLLDGVQVKANTQRICRVYR